MGDLQFRLVEHQFVIKQQIKVDSPRTPTILANSSERVFDFLTGAQKLLR